MVDSLPSGLRRLEQNAEMLTELRLSDKLVEASRSELRFV
jgi:hypothetical protein